MNFLVFLFSVNYKSNNNNGSRRSNLLCKFALLATPKGATPGSSAPLLLDLIKNPVLEKIKNINRAGYYKNMIVAISGKAGSGKSTVAKMLAKKLKLNHYSIGDLMREMAKEKKISLLELSKLAENDKSIDKELDKKQIELGKKGNFVIDSRLAAFFIPQADFKVFLDCDDTVRAERIMKDNREIEKSKNSKEMMKEIKKREESERKRYKEYYGVDCYDKRLYDLVIDTSRLSVDEVVDEIMKKQKP